LEDARREGQAIVDAATTPSEATDLHRQDVSYFHGSPERARYGSFAPAGGIDYRATWIRLRDSEVFPATHRLVAVSVNFGRIAVLQAWPRVRVLDVVDLGVQLWDASDPRGSVPGSSPGYLFRDLPLTGTDATGKDHQHVFLEADGSSVWVAPRLEGDFTTDPYLRQRDKPFKARGQTIWYAVPVGDRFAPRSGRHGLKSQWPRDSLHVDRRSATRVIRAETIPEDQLQLMYWYSLRLGAGAGGSRQG
jgi:hypothetical protein